ncbi:MAG: hypothetical protein ACK43N_19475, partial [Pirellulaceae bacterium]
MPEPIWQNEKSFRQEKAIGSTVRGCELGDREPMIRQSGRWLLGCWMLMLWADPAAAQQVRVEPMQGEAFDGRWLEGTPDRLVFQSADGPRTFPAQDLQQIRVSGGKATSNASGSGKEDGGILQLADGTLLAVRTLEWKDGKGQWTSASDAGTLPANAVTWWLLRKPDASQRESWDRMLSQKADGDQLVVVRGDGSVDQVVGTILSVSADQVEFEFDGQTIQAPKERLLGVVWFRKESPEVSPGVAIESVDGSRWNATQWKWDRNDGDSGTLALQTSSGVSHRLRYDQLATIDFGTSNISWLADIPALQSSIQPRLGVETAGGTSALSPLWTSRMADATKSRDLLFLNDGFYETRVPTGCDRFLVTLVRPNSEGLRAELSVEMWQEDQQVAQQTIGPDQSELPLEAAVTPGKKLQLRVRT